MQLIYRIDIFEDNYNIVRDRFETDSVNVMKNRSLVAKKQRKSQYMLAARSNHQRCSIKKGVLKNFTKFTGKHLCQRLFFNKVPGQACNFIKKESLTQVFSCEFCKNFKNTFFTEHLRATASELPQSIRKP